MTIKFNLLTDNYSTFIQQVRDWAKDPKRSSHGRSVLPYPPSDPKKAEYMDIELRAKLKDKDENPRLLIVKIKRHNLYVVGYLMEGAQKWLEFKPDKEDDPTVIPNSQTLGFSGNYNSLGQPKQVGYNIFKNCITNLAVTTDSGTRKSSLSALTVMISESVRFQKLFDLFYKQMQGKADINYERWMGILVKYWDKLSNRLLCEDQFAITFRLPVDPETREPHILTKTKELNIVTSGDAAKFIAVLLGKPASIKDLEEGGYPIQWRGTRLLQVFSVAINTNSDAQIYGKVEVKDDFGTYVLYNRQRTVSEFVRNTHTLTLDGPANRCLSSRNFKVSLDLKEQGKTPPVDTEVSNGSFEYKVYEVNKIFDDRLNKVVSSKSGSSTTVYFTAFRDAIQATVEVVLTYVDPKEDPVDLYGSLVNRYSNYEYLDEETKMYYGTALFKKPGKDNSVTVQKGSMIPLSRPVIAVPTSGNLILDARLISAKSGNYIALGSVEFLPQLDGKSVQEIRGKFGHVRVTVSWKVVPDSI